jgi:primosomal protein N' (replication factor Y) (superfamily II helicase)
MRVCRVQPDVVAVRRAFEYLVPAELDEVVRVGTVVRVPLHGRRVRGWVLDADVAADAVEAPLDRLRPILAAVSAGPPPEVVDLCRWAAWHWAGPAATFLRAASPPNVLGVATEPDVGAAVYPTRLEPGHPWAGDALIVTAPSRAVALQPLAAPEGSTLVLVPSAAAGEVLARAFAADGRDVVQLFSDQSAADLTRSWDRARAGACVVVGGRAAVWAPVPDLATVIVLDERDEAFDDERAPTWNARDVALERARRAGASVRMITPAPSVEALVALGDPEPATGGGNIRGGWPRVEVVDVRDQEPGQALVTRELADALHRAVDAGARAVCVLNRRGRARLLACRTCRELTRCERCGATVSEREEGLACVVCDTVRPVVCLHCHGTRLRPVKPGVAHVRDDLAALLPRVAVDVVDASTVGTPSAPVVVGTEAVLHRVAADLGAPGALDPGKRVGVVAYLELDQELLAPRSRAAEQALWLLVRGARPLGAHPAPPGVLLLQTRVPDHEVVVAVQRGDTVSVAQADRVQREQLGFPPFGGLAALSGDPAAVAHACSALRNAALRSGALRNDAVNGTAVTVLGPVDDGRRALVRAATWDRLADALGTHDVDAAHAIGRLRVDVDPRRI